MRISIPLAFLISIGTVIPTMAVALIWYVTLATTASPLEWALAVLLILWIGLTNFTGCMLVFYVTAAHLKRRSAQAFIHTSDFEQQLSTLNNQQLSNIAQVLTIQKTEILSRQYRNETPNEVHQRLTNIIRKKKSYLEHNEKNNA
ncbi:hypothetical protein [Levilactobacillus fuyuanensis]|uniref:hypothetical protein n=1 Tax=Levilactobacillus fuyuanensis TaxID=2486022 RepID=UPI000F7752DB|nr:hypothetical protein [Levilactobacillus fuyuanensis]